MTVPPRTKLATLFCLVYIKKSNYTLGFFVQCSGTNSLFLTLNKKYCRKCKKGWKGWHMHTLVSMHWIAMELVAIKMFYCRIVNDKNLILKVGTFIEKWVLKPCRGSTLSKLSKASQSKRQANRTTLFMLLSILPTMYARYIK